MDFRAILDCLDDEGRVSAVYLAGRYLTHSLNQDEFRRKLKRDRKTNYSEAIVQAVSSIVTEIETREHCLVASLSMASRVEYASTLGALVLDRRDAAVDPMEVDRGLAGLA